jgi:transcription elongation GreA/GreB family factor
MNKKDLFAKVIDRLEQDRVALAEAAMNTYQAATHEESEPEDQYDTRGLEASYLAGAQAKRVAEIDQLILNLRYLELKTFGADDPIAAGALVEIDHEGRTMWCLLLPKGGGMSIEHEGHTIHLVTPQSPIGEAIMGRLEGDSTIVDMGQDSREYEIVSVE